MINFNKHLKEILYEHDFIVLPRLGAFIADFSIDDTGDAAVPSKSFVFNNLLTFDENNKYFNYILSKETVSFSDIEIQWNEYVSDLKSDLNSGQRKEIPGIGYYVNNEAINFEFNKGINFYSRDEAIQGVPFSQVESLEVNTDIETEENDASTANVIEDIVETPATINDSFANNSESINQGLKQETILDSTDETTTEEEFETDSFLEEVYEEEEQRRTFWWWLLPLILFGLFALTYWWMNRSYESVEKNTVPIETVAVPDSTAMVDSSSTTDGFQTNENNSSTINDQSSNSSIVNTNSKAAKGVFHVWAGLFRKKSNAEKLQQKLIKNDIPAEIQAVKNMRRVYVPVQTEREAQKLVKRIEQLTGDKAVYFEVD